MIEVQFTPDLLQCDECVSVGHITLLLHPLLLTIMQDHAQLWSALKLDKAATHTTHPHMRIISTHQCMPSPQMKFSGTVIMLLV